MKKSKAEIVLRALQIGMQVELPDGVYKIVDGETCIQSRKFLMSSGIGWESHEHWLYTELSLDHFIKLCNDINETDLFLIGANIALNTLREE